MDSASFGRGSQTLLYDAGDLNARDTIYFAFTGDADEDRNTQRWFGNFDIQGTVVPGPSTLAMLGIGALVIAGARKRRQVA